MIKTCVTVTPAAPISWMSRRCGVPTTAGAGARRIFPPARLSSGSLGLGGRRRGDHVETNRQRGPLLPAALPRRQFLHLLQKLLEAGGMMHDQERCALGARVVKAVDRLSRDERERAGWSGVPLVADTEHQLALENVEEFVAPAMIVRSRTDRPGRDSSFPDRAQAPGLGGRGLDRYACSGGPDRNESSLSGRHHDRVHDITGVSPWRRMISAILTRSGGPPAAASISAAHSRKNCGPIAAGVMAHTAFTSWLPSLSNR